MILDVWVQSSSSLFPAQATITLWDACYKYWGFFTKTVTSVGCWTLLTYNVYTHTHKSYLAANNLITACIHLHATRHLLRNLLCCLAGSQSGPEVRSEHRFVTALNHIYTEQSTSQVSVSSHSALNTA